VTGVKKVKKVTYINKGEQEPVKKVPIWFEVRDPVKSFTGRDDELKHLHDVLQSKGGQAVVSQITSISGLGGIGKSELARKYAYDYKKYYGDNVVWINAETQESIRKSFQGLATQKLRIPITEKKDEKEQERDIKSIIEDVYKYFQKAESLFILDNAEQYKSIYEYLPSYFYLHSNDNKPHVLITSRNQEWEVGEEGKIEVIKLNEFTPKEAVDFIKKTLNIENDLQNEHIEKLARELQYFPLALRQAVTYIREMNKKSERRGHKKFEISDYQKKYEKDAQELLEFSHESDRYAKTTFLTWKITLENIMQIGDNGKQALEILEIMAYLSPDKIPIEGFFSKLLFNEQIIGEERSWSAVDLLSDYSMINVEKGLSNIHRLVQQVIRLHNQSKEEEILEKALKLINSAELAKNNSSHVTSVWDYASKYGKLIDEFYFNSFYDWDKKTPLHLLAENGHGKAIEAILIHIGKNALNETRKIIYTPTKHFNHTPFETAIKSGYLDVIKVFVEKGADAKAADKDGYTPLHWAAEKGHLDVVKYLVEKGADAKAADKDGYTPLHMAAVQDYLDVVKYLVEEKGADVKAANNDGNTPLHRAARYGNLDLVKYLVEKGADVKAADKDGYTPLHWAAEKSNLDIVKYLVEKGADAKAANKDGWTPLHMAAVKDYLDVVKYLVEEIGADVEATDKDGRTPLQWAAFLHRDLDIVKYLVEEKGADLKAADNDGNNPLHWAAENGNLDVVKYLVEKGADVNAANNDGCTLLHWAADCGYLDIVKYLVGEKGADFKAADKYGVTPLHSAAYSGRLDVVKYLVEEKGADVKAANKDGDTPLHRAAKKVHWDVVKYFVEKGADVKAANNDGDTPLHWAAGNGNLDVVKYLVEEKCADVLARNSHDTVLHRAVSGNNKEIIRFFLDKIKEKFNQDSQQVYQYINAQDTEGDTPLMWAAENGRISAAQVLLEYSVDINFKIMMV
jgi:ankyrin repeat protein